MSYAELHNVGLARAAYEKLMRRDVDVPAMGVLYGPAGYGKSVAATIVANQSRAFFVQMRSVWSRKNLLEKILVEMGVELSATLPTLAKMLDMVVRELAASQRLLIIDEADYCVKNAGMIELIRDIYEGAGGAPILLIGEEMMPVKLKKWERFHSRVLTWVPVQPVSLDDARALLKHRCGDEIEVRDDLLAEIVSLSRGSVRRVAVNLEILLEVAATEGWLSVGKDEWGSRGFYTGDAPARRRAT